MSVFNRSQAPESLRPKTVREWEKKVGDWEKKVTDVAEKISGRIDSLESPPRRDKYRPQLAQETQALLQANDLTPNMRAADKALLALVHPPVQGSRPSELMRALAVDDALSFNAHVHLGVRLTLGYLAGRRYDAIFASHLGRLLDGRYREPDPGQAANTALPWKQLLSAYTPGGLILDNLFALSEAYDTAHQDKDPNRRRELQRICLLLCEQAWSTPPQQVDRTTALRFAKDRVLRLAHAPSEAEVLLLLAGLGTAALAELRSISNMRQRDVHQNHLQGQKAHALQMLQQAMLDVEEAEQNALYEEAIESVVGVRNLVVKNFPTAKIQQLLLQVLSCQLDRVCYKALQTCVRQDKARGRALVQRTLAICESHGLEAPGMFLAHALYAESVSQLGSRTISKQPSYVFSESAPPDDSPEATAAGLSVQAAAGSDSETASNAPGDVVAYVGEHAERLARNPQIDPRLRARLSQASTRLGYPERTSSLASTHATVRAASARSAASTQGAPSSAGSLTSATSQLANVVMDLLKQPTPDHGNPVTEIEMLRVLFYSGPEHTTEAQQKMFGLVCKALQDQPAAQTVCVRFFRNLHAHKFFALEADFSQLRLAVEGAPTDAPPAAPAGSVAISAADALRATIVVHLSEPDTLEALRRSVELSWAGRDITALRSLHAFVRRLWHDNGPAHWAFPAADLAAFSCWQPRWHRLNSTAKLIAQIDARTAMQNGQQSSLADELQQARTVLERLLVLEGPMTSLTCRTGNNKTLPWVLGKSPPCTSLSHQLETSLERDNGLRHQRVDVNVHGTHPVHFVFADAHVDVLRAWLGRVHEAVQDASEHDPEALAYLDVLEAAGRCADINEELEVLSQPHSFEAL